MFDSLDQFLKTYKDGQSIGFYDQRGILWQLSPCGRAKEDEHGELGFDIRDTDFNPFDEDVIKNVSKPSLQHHPNQLDVSDTVIEVPSEEDDKAQIIDYK